MLIRHPTSGQFWSVNDAREVCLAKEGSVYVKSTCGVPPHVATWDQNTSHLKNTVTGKCICRLGDKLAEADHGGIANGSFEWTIIDGVVQNFQGLYVDGDLSLVDKTSVQWHVADSFEDEVPVEDDVPVEDEEEDEVPVEDEEEDEVPVEDEGDVPVVRASALIEEALNAQAADDHESDEEVPDLVSESDEPEPEVTPDEPDEPEPEPEPEAEEPEPEPEPEEPEPEPEAEEPEPEPEPEEPEPEPEAEEPEPEVTPEIEQAIAETVADVLAPAEEAPTDEVEA